MIMPTHILKIYNNSKEWTSSNLNLIIQGEKCNEKISIEWGTWTYRSRSKGAFYKLYNICSGKYFALRLAVKPGNRAEGLYHQLGFISGIESSSMILKR